MSIFGKNIIQYMIETVLNEAYIGKTPILLEIEKEIDAFRKENPKMTDSNSTNPHIIKINRLFEKQFNMNTFALKIMPSSQLNGYTCVIGRRIDIAREVDLPNMVEGNINSGFKFKDGNDFVVLVYLYYGLITKESLTPAQIVAIILHEIGHNFADCLYGEINFANKELMQKYEEYLIQQGLNMGILEAILTFNLIKWLQLQKISKMLSNEEKKKDEEKFKKNSSRKNKIRGLLSGIGGKISDWVQIRNAVRVKIKGKASIEKWKRMNGSLSKESAKKSLNRQNEVIADKFAGIYGYGPEITSALTVMEFSPTKADEKIAKMSKRAQKAALEYDKASMDLNDYDEHPNLVQRIYEEIKLLKREYEKEDIDPKVKKIIKEQLDELENILKDVTDTKKKISESEDARRAYNDYVNKNCPNAVSDEIEDKIEEALDKLLEESKKKAKGGKK